MGAWAPGFHPCGQGPFHFHPGPQQHPPSTPMKWDGFHCPRGHPFTCPVAVLHVLQFQSMCPPRPIRTTGETLSGRLHWPPNKGSPGKPIFRSLTPDFQPLCQVHFLRTTLHALYRGQFRGPGQTEREVPHQQKRQPPCPDLQVPHSTMFDDLQWQLTAPHPWWGPCGAK